MSSVNYQSVIIELNNFKDYLNGDLSLDDCNMIDQFISETGLKSLVVYECLKLYEKEGISRKGLSQKIVTLRTDLHDYIDKRIYLLTHLKEIHLSAAFLFQGANVPKIGNDPWLAYSFKKITQQEELIKASLHSRDLLFAAQEVINVIPEKIESFFEELNIFNEILPSYLKLLKKFGKEEKENIQHAFNELAKLIKDNQLEEINCQLSHIRKILRHMSC